MVQLQKLLLVFYIVSSPAYAQPAREIAGSVKDQETGEPLAWASIEIGRRGIGTNSNSSGEFSISVQPDWEHDSLIVRFLGYRRYTKKINELPPHLNISLSPEVVVLDNVRIEATKVSGDDIIKKAIAAVGVNYPTKAFMLEGYFRELIREDGRHVALAEAAMKVFDKSFQRKLNQGITEDVQIVASRQSKNYATEIVKTVRKQNSIIDLLDNNPVHYQRGILNPKYFKYTIDSIVQNDDQTVFIISTNPMNHKIYVEDGSFAILKTIEEVSDAGRNRPEFRLNDSLIVRRMAYFQSVCEFQRFRGKMYVKYLNETDAYEILHKTSHHRKFYVESFKEFVVTSVMDSAVRPLEKKIRYDYTDAGLARAHAPSFWSHPATIHLAPLDRTARKELEWEMPLEKQFQEK